MSYPQFYLNKADQDRVDQYCELVRNTFPCPEGFQEITSPYITMEIYDRDTLTPRTLHEFDNANPHYICYEKWPNSAKGEDKIYRHISWFVQKKKIAATRLPCHWSVK